MKITQEQYENAQAQKKEAEEIINAFHNQKESDFDARWARFQAGEAPFTDEELRYSAGARCSCGSGLAYPKNCGGFHRWDCSEFLKGDRTKPHDGPFHFAFYSIKSEDQPSAYGATTRPKTDV